VIALTVVVAVLMAFGVPLAWLYIGSQLQGDTGATQVSFTVAMITLAGIIVTYLGILWVAGWAQSRAPHDDDRAGSHRAPWMRSMRDTPHRHGEDDLTAIERTFVMTTLIAFVAFLFWFAFIAGSPLPNQ
jgi:hypothetical protein